MHHKGINPVQASCNENQSCLITKHPFQEIVEFFFLPPNRRKCDKSAIMGTLDNEIEN